MLGFMVIWSLVDLLLVCFFYFYFTVEAVRMVCWVYDILEFTQIDACFLMHLLSFGICMCSNPVYNVQCPS